MEIEPMHEWHVTTTQAINIQSNLAKQVSTTSEMKKPRFIAGIDVSMNRIQATACAAVVILSYPGLELAEVKVFRDTINFPYIPGLLSFREAPVILKAFETLNICPDLVIVDGQGIAHPRRFGLASHLGLWLDIPTIGCAKSLLCGKCDTPEIEIGSHTKIFDVGITIGASVRTKEGVKPVFVSTGHKVDLDSAIHWVLQCCNGHRLPEPTRLAHLAAGGNMVLKV